MWTGHNAYTQTTTPHSNASLLQANPRNTMYYGQHQYIQPHYGQTSPPPLIAELPAPMPPAPPTTTPDQQLKEDELLAHKIQQLEVNEVRRRSSSAANYQQLPSSVLSTSPQGQSPLLHHQSSQPFRPHSQSISPAAAVFTPGSIGATPLEHSPSLLPEVVTRPRASLYNPQSPSENLPIPVLQERQIPPPPSIPLDPLSLSLYLEQHHQVPYPHQWVLFPAISTFHTQINPSAPGTSWLDTPQSCAWGKSRRSESQRKPSPAIFTFVFKTTHGSLRSPKHSWVMSYAEETPETSKKLSKSKGAAWTYDLKLDPSTGMRKSEVLSHGREKSVLTTYVHAMNYDSLRFIGPDGRAYMWVSSTRLSSMNGSRYDTLRHALFTAVGNIPDPLYGQIVADHAYWDGYVNEMEVHDGTICNGCRTAPINGSLWRCKSCVNHEICNTCRTRSLSGQVIESILPMCRFSLVNLPDETIYIRSPNVDPALVVATLQILKDWEKHTLRGEKSRDSQGFGANEEWARSCDLGIKAHWRAEDLNRKDIPREPDKIVAKTSKAAASATEAVPTLANLADAGLKLGSIHARNGSTTGREG
ncbi:hypothetical protein IQ07DRAFT_502670 [Pyrenochaeta sp. DS3sAY3a]|nr:hypothetical protein IQ07DRAFT_502670 [Pyrenochaeta sp. DS3sAY3a]